MQKLQAYAFLCVTLAASSQTHAMGARAANWILKTGKTANLALTFASSLGVAKKIATDEWGNQDYTAAPVASERVKNYCKTLANQCNLNPHTLQVKVREEHEFEAVHDSTILMSQNNMHDLDLFLEQKSPQGILPRIKLLFRKPKGEWGFDAATVTIRHEMGHLYYKDASISHQYRAILMPEVAVCGTTLGLWKLGSALLPIKPIVTIGKALCAVPALIASGIVKQQLAQIIRWPMMYRREEARADSFAFSHTHDPKELIAFAQFFENFCAKKHADLEKEFEDPDLLETMITPWKIPVVWILAKNYDNRPPEMSGQQWIENKSKLLFKIFATQHPHPLDRARAARERAAQLQKKQSLNAQAATKG